MEIEKTSEEFKNFCYPRWEEYNKGKIKVDPCGSCKLYRICCVETPHGIEAYNNWIRNRNEAVKNL